MTDRGQAVPAGGAPGPLVSGNLYCSGCLDAALLGAIVPFRRTLRDLDHESPAYLWCIRYSRHGEHLKVRVHAPPALEAEVRRELEAAANRFLDGLGPCPEAAERRVRADAPPIDREDRLPDAPPDRSFLFTHYQASSITLGGEPYLSDAGYRSRLTLCLARGCDLLLSWLESREQAPSHSQRQQILLRAIVSGLGALGLPRSEVTDYLAYHRDWMIRFPVLRQGRDEEVANGLLADLDRQAGKVERTVSALRAASRGLGEPAAPSDRGDGADPFGAALAGLAGYLDDSFGGREERPDPFTRRPAFPGLFKALHGLANQVGVKQLDEAFAYHLLLCAMAPDEGRYQRIALTPD